MWRRHWYCRIPVALLVAKLVPAHHHGDPPIAIRSEGSDQRLTRGVLASALEELFPKGNDTWRILNAAGNPGSRCAGLSAGARRSTGHSATVPYVFAGWLQVRLSDYVYANAAAAAAAQDASPLASSRAAAACDAHVIAEGLQGLGYEVGKPEVSPKHGCPDRRRCPVATHRGPEPLQGTAPRLGLRHDLRAPWTSHPRRRDRHSGALPADEPGVGARTRAQGCVSSVASWLWDVARLRQVGNSDSSDDR